MKTKAQYWAVAGFVCLMLPARAFSLFDAKREALASYYQVELEIPHLQPRGAIAWNVYTKETYRKQIGTVEQTLRSKNPGDEAELKLLALLADPKRNKLQKKLVDFHGFFADEEHTRLFTMVVIGAAREHVTRGQAGKSGITLTDAGTLQLLDNELEFTDGETKYVYVQPGSDGNDLRVIALNRDGSWDKVELKDGNIVGQVQSGREQ